MFVWFVTMSLLTIQDVSCATTDGRLLFHSLDISMRTERIGLVGRNGVGKSTLLHIISGAIPPATGSVRANGTIGVLRQVIASGSEETVADLFGLRNEFDIFARIEAGVGSDTPQIGCCRNVFTAHCNSSGWRMSCPKQDLLR
jgi:ATPase subunit of ABC transporter with duplicated ATPase domains